MRKIKLKDAKSKLSALVDEAGRGRPSVITRHGKPVAVVLGFDEWERLLQVPSLGRLLMSAPLEASDLPPRKTDRKTRREVLEAARASAATKASAGPTAARSQDFLYDKDGLPK